MWIWSTTFQNAQKPATGWLSRAHDVHETDSGRCSSLSYHSRVVGLLNDAARSRGPHRDRRRDARRSTRVLMPTACGAAARARRRDAGRRAAAARAAVRHALLRASARPMRASAGASPAGCATIAAAGRPRADRRRGNRSAPSPVKSVSTSPSVSRPACAAPRRASPTTRIAASIPGETRAAWHARSARIRRGEHFAALRVHPGHERDACRSPASDRPDALPRARRAPRRQRPAVRAPWPVPAWPPDRCAIR